MTPVEWKMKDSLPPSRQAHSDSRLHGEQIRYRETSVSVCAALSRATADLLWKPIFSKAKHSSASPCLIFFSFCYCSINFIVFWTQEYNLNICLKSKMTKLSFFHKNFKFLVTWKKVVSALNIRSFYFSVLSFLILVPWFLESAPIYCHLLLGQLHCNADWFSCSLLQFFNFHLFSSFVVVVYLASIRLASLLVWLA